MMEFNVETKGKERIGFIDGDNDLVIFRPGESALCITTDGDVVTYEKDELVFLEVQTPIFRGDSIKITFPES